MNNYNYVNRVQHLYMKALQSLFLLLGLAPSFAAAVSLVKSESCAPLSQRKIMTARSLLKVLIGNAPKRHQLLH